MAKRGERGGASGKKANGRERKNRRRDDGREPIWSVSPGWRTMYFATFSVSTLVTTCLIVAYTIANRGDANLMETYLTITQRVFINGGALALTLYAITETWETAMVLANYLRQNLLEPLKERQREEGREEGRVEGREEGREEGRSEGRLESYAEWRAWNERRERAAARGEPFDEPPPSLD